MNCTETTTSSDKKSHIEKNDNGREKRTLNLDSTRKNNNGNQPHIQRRITHNVGPYQGVASNYIDNYSGAASLYDKNYYETGYKQNVNYQPSYTVQNEQYHHGGYQQQYSEPPEPIIEIIIKESNESLPSNAVPVQLPTKKKKEQVQVFYVKYNKDKNNGLVIDDPIPGLFVCLFFVIVYQILVST